MTETSVQEAEHQGGILCRALRLLRSAADGQQRAILDGIDAHFDAGELSLITGAIGSGKSTLLHVLSTILRPTSGEVLADGEAVSRYAGSHRDRWRRQAGLAFQSAHFFDELTVLENVLVPLVPNCSSLAAARSTAKKELEAFEIAHLAQRRLAGLSGGERQRITLARALVNEPRFIFADEPTAHQDAPGVELIVKRLQALRDQGAAVIVVSHDDRLKDGELADRCFHLESGKLSLLAPSDSKPAAEETP
jgi:ABC-type lipoprotein export system ATPase subunit